MSAEPFIDLERVPSVSQLTDEQRQAFAIVDQIVEARTNNVTEIKDVIDWSFFLGITDALLVAWAMGAKPQYMWMIYIANASVLFYLRIKDVSQPKTMTIVRGVEQPLVRLFYLFEFCYIANFGGILFCIALVFDQWLNLITDTVASALFSGAFGISCGTLLGATFLFKNKILFHDMSNTVSVLIHLLPSMVMYGFRWDYFDMQQNWPTLFNRGPFDTIPLVDIYKFSVIAYMCWFVPYMLWLLLHGRTLPQRTGFDTCFKLNKDGKSPYDTCFHFNMRDHATKMGEMLICTVFRKDKAELKRKRIEHDFSVAEIVVYNLGHATLALGLVSLSLGCYKWKLFHQIALAVVSLNSIYLGSGVYARHVAFAEQYKNVKKRIGGV